MRKQFRAPPPEEDQIPFPSWVTGFDAEEACLQLVDEVLDAFQDVSG